MCEVAFGWMRNHHFFWKGKILIFAMKKEIIMRFFFPSLLRITFLFYMCMSLMSWLSPTDFCRPTWIHLTTFVRVCVCVCWAKLRTWQNIYGISWRAAAAADLTDCGKLFPAKKFPRQPTTTTTISGRLTHFDWLFFNGKVCYDRFSGRASTHTYYSPYNILRAGGNKSVLPFASFWASPIID